jgi:hypothetical protein
MRSLRSLAAGAFALAAIVVAGPAGACDPDALDEQLAELCRAPLQDLAVMLAAARPPADEAARLGRELEAARAACRDRQYEAGLVRQIRIARDIGRLDGRRLASAQ